MIQHFMRKSSASYKT